MTPKCEGPVCKFCDEFFHCRTIMEKEEYDWIEGYEHLNRHVGWRCPYCLRSIDFCPQCGTFITEDDYKPAFYDPDPQYAGYKCPKCGFEEEI